ncbi:MAG: hypothetical protein ACLQGJ_05070 [Candidatus Dormibacteria bacterium]
MRSAKDLQDEAEQREKEDDRRLAEYRRTTAPYFGEGRRGQQNIQANYADGRAALRWMGSSGAEDEVSADDVLNMIPEIVDSIVAVRGVEPTHAVRPEGPSNQQMEQATKRTRALREQHNHSGMVTQGAQLAFFLVAMGDAAIVINPRVQADVDAEKERLGREDPFRPLGVYLSVVNPSTAFPHFRQGYTVNELEDLFVIFRLAARDAKLMYGIDVDKDAKVIHYYGQSEKRILVDGRDVIRPVEHDLGFCPAVWCTNKASDGRTAQSDIRMAISMNRQLGLTYSIYLDSLIWSVHPIVHVHDREHVETPSGSPEIGPGATVSTVQTGDVELIAPEGRPEVAGSMVQMLMSAIHQVTGVSPIQTEGKVDGSNISARSVDRQMSPMETRLALSNTLLAESYQLLNAKVLLMLSDLPAFKGVEFPLYGQDSGGTYNETFSQADIGGWIRTKTTWDASIGTSKHEVLAMWLQMFKESVVTPEPYRVPFRVLLEAMGVEDPDQMMNEAFSEHQKAMGVLQASGGGPPGPGGPAGPGGPPHGGGGAPGEPPKAMQDASALQQGGLAAAGPPQGGGAPVQPPPPAPAPPGGASIPGFEPNAAPPTSQGIGTPAPVLDVAKMAYQAIQKLHLYEPITDILVRGGPNHSIDIKVTDHRDIAQVRQAVQNVAGNLQVIVKMRPARKESASSESTRRA